ncbi:Acetyltransferase (GNAT) family protein [Vibrio aerogenes CECT 7868]|uniref:Acetyltransferase (GNAT) family protein n=1 Tax=Vibrio aerogenes CECT 7868 TaxID=1216006 RepID=A0A1M6D5V7_9VIBR|nr:GNAT family N-acetyltransferase [Vibrio aerogenes]SHI68642.1 Acetyltransferase (GNAT) family protein [Vibrio aerogenes CECT 7868]
MNTKTAQEDVIIRPMDEKDMADAHVMTQALHWPHTLQDWQQIVSVGHALVMEAEGRLIGTACLVPQGKYASVGLIVISDDFQGRGLGRQIMNDIMSCAEPGSYLYLTATEMGKPLYQKIGFEEYAVIEQYQNVVETEKVTLVHPKADAGIRKMDVGEEQTLKQMMNASCGMDRGAIGDLVLNTSNQTLVIEDEGKITGFAVCRDFGRGCCIGPVIAENPQHALALISHQLLACDQQFVRLDIVNQYREIGTQLSAWGLNKVDTVSQMVKGEVPRAEGDLIQFCLVSQAMG